MHRLLLTLIAPLLVWGGDADFNGRWNITVDGGVRVWWLKIAGAGTPAIAGEFVGAPGGGLDRIPEVLIRDGELQFAFRRHYRGEDRDARQQGQYRARLVNGKLEGTFQVEGDPRVAKWSGVRAPEIRDESSRWIPERAIELFNGRDLSGWHPTNPNRGMNWTVEGGILRNNPGTSDIATDQKFWNFRIQLEYRLREHSNAGVGLRARYEVQIYDDHGRPASDKGHASIYSRIQPSRNASKPAGEWQMLDITLIGRRVTVVLNGATVIRDQEIEGLTAIATDANEAEPGPIQIQGDHTVVEYRKITLTPLKRVTS